MNITWLKKTNPVINGNEIVLENAFRDSDGVFYDLVIEQEGGDFSGHWFNQKAGKTELARKMAETWKEVFESQPPKFFDGYRSGLTFVCFQNRCLFQKKPQTTEISEIFFKLKLFIEQTRV